MTPRVSVLIGAYNNASTIRQAIDSILGQTVENLELIVIDDGSADATRDVVTGVKDTRLRYLRRRHQGISPSLNAGIAAASAPVIAVQDADDWSEPHRLERQLAVLDADQRVAVVGSRMREVDETGSPLRPRTVFAAGDVREVLMRFNPIPNSCAAFRREVVRELGGYDARYLYAMEYDVWLRVADLHAVVALDEPLATRRMSRSNVAARRERAQIAETIALRVAAMRRRRSARGAYWLAVPALSYVTPLPVKRAVRRALGQAP